MSMEVYDFHGAEDRDAIRFSWNAWPSSKLEATRAIVPLGCLYTPLKHIPTMPPAVPYEPIRCKATNCGAVLNPFCQVDFTSKLWVCPFCMTRNHFPPHYANNITPTNLPAELIPQFTTLEYEVRTRAANPPVFLFVVDTCQDEEELSELKDSLRQSLNLLPETAMVGLITFGAMAHVHELGFSEFPRSYVFRGNKDYTAAQVRQMLGLGAPGPGAPQASAPAEAAARFLLPVSECEFALETVLEDLHKDMWPKARGSRHQRCTGVALSVAVGLLESTFPRSGARVMLFAAGPATIGPGMIVSPKLSETMRSHTDLQKENAPYYRAALKFYTALAQRCVNNCHVVDVFVCSLDQVGVLEMKPCVERTGGLAVMGDSFGQSVFKESFHRVFARFPKDAPPCDAGHLKMGFAGTLEVLTTREARVCGAIGPCSSLRRGSPCVSETEIGEGGTYAWSMGAMTPNTTVALYFEVANKDAALTPGKRRFLQLVTRYQHSSGSYRMRVTTVSGAWHSDPANTAALGASFDQEAAAVLMARIACYRTQTEELGDILRWLDRSLIRLCARFGDYHKDTPDSFRLSPEFSIYPQFMFHLRRSQFLQLMNNSPDESAYYRMVLNAENTTNSLVMIQPALLSYSFQGPPQPVLLDVTAIRPDNILLLDTFFHVVVHHGETIATWRQQGYQDNPEHINFKNLLEAPLADAQAVMESRFPVPRFIVCDQNKSQARFLLHKLNPSVTHNTMDGAHAPVFTDDVSLKVFMEHLMKLAVQS